MAQPKVTFNISAGGLGRKLPGYDHYSAMIAYYKASGTIAGYANIGNKTYTSLVDAENDGVVATYAESTAATVTDTVSNKGADGDVVTATFTNWDGTVITLGSYTKVTADSTVTLVATSLVAAINALTYSHGFSATVGVSGAYTVTAPKKLGVYPNSKGITYTYSAGATLAISTTTFAGGTISRLAVWHYQISEFFRMNPLGVLYFSIKFDDSAQSASAFQTQVTANIISVQNAFAALNVEAGGARQMLIYTPERTFATGILDAVKSARTTLASTYLYSEFFVVSNYSATALGSFTNTRLLSDSGVSQVISTSGTGVGLQYYYTQSTVISNGGNALGVESSANVAQSIGDVSAFNVSNGTENEKTWFMDSSFTEYLSLQASNATLLDQLCDYGYVYTRKLPNKVGTYWVGGNAAVVVSDDLAYRENSRTMDKAIRNTYANIVNLLNSKLILKSDGTLSDQAAQAFYDKCDDVLAQMVRDTELSSYSINVSRTEVVSTTSNVPITLSLVPVGIAKTITIKIGFVASL